MKKVDLTKGNVMAVIVALALPIMGSSILQFTYNIVDMMWVGKLGSNAVASIGSSSLFINIGNALNSLVVTGTAIKTAQAFGRKNNEEVKEYINSGIIINIITALIFSCSLIFFGKYMIHFLNLNNYIVERDSYYYLILNAFILFFSFFNMLYTRIIGSFGNNKTAFKINSIGVIFNIVLDPVFIYVFRLGVAGAAVSTLIANITMFLLFKIKSDGMLNYDFKIIIDSFKIKEIIKMGFPISFQRIIFTFINIFLAKIIAIFGSDAIAAQKIGVQIESVAYMVVGGFNGAVASFTGQNFGALKFERIKKGYRSSIILGIVYSSLITIIFLVFNRNLIKLFISEESTIIIASSYLNVVAFSQVFSSVEMISNGLFTGIGKPNIPASISIIFTALRIPLAFILLKPFGINGVWISICLSSILKGIFSYLVYEFIAKRKYI